MLAGYDCSRERSRRTNSALAFLCHLADPDVWYTMKLEVEIKDGKAHLFGKVWDRSEEEPKEWSLKVVDPKPNMNGSPGLWSYALADCFFDNVVIIRK